MSVTTQNLPSSANQQQRKVINDVVASAASDPRFLGVSLSGSGAEDNLDDYSDLDFILAIHPDHFDAVMQERTQFAEQIGTLLTSFTGEHVGESRLLICLFALPQLLHVDLKFVALPDVSERVDTPVVLWERNDKQLSQFYQNDAHYPVPTLQWFEDRFWVWLHYGATKLVRGEHLECHALIGFVSETVIGPLAKVNSGFEANGLRRLEALVPNVAATLTTSLCFSDASSLGEALRTIAALYLQLRNNHTDISTLTCRNQAQEAAMQFTEVAIKDAIAQETRRSPVVK
ncbi:oxalate:formate antiporter [Alteromonas sp. H39]|uniref:oxalate:formate antiporter n=1 Tax=Alteromonas sp. H39 TaxID=3389876 RepID=UPI0039DFF504